MTTQKRKGFAATAGDELITMNWRYVAATAQNTNPATRQARSNVDVSRDPPPGARRFCLGRCQRRYDLDTALAVAPQFADQGIAGLEQPLPANRLSWYRRLMRQKALPILMDEPIVTAVDLEEFHQLGLLDGVAMKLSRCGGLDESCRILDYMEQNGCCSSPVGSPIPICPWLRPWRYSALISLRDPPR